MQTVDVDGSGFVDLDEFTHMTRRLLGVDCEVTCKVKQDKLCEREVAHFVLQLRAESFTCAPARR